MDGEGIEALREELGAPPPRGLAEALDDDRARALAAALREARRRQSEALGRASREALDRVPRLLRGPVRKVVFR